MLAVKFYEVFNEEEEALKLCMPAGWNALYAPKTIQEEGDGRLPAELISIRTQSRIPLDWSTGLRGILTRSQGYDHIQSYRAECGKTVPAGYLEQYCSRAVAEHAIMVMFCLFRKLKKQFVHFDHFYRDGLTGCECKGKNAVVLGVGQIGTEIVDILQGLRMHVKGVDIVHNLDHIEYVSLEEGVQWGDVLFCAVPLTGETRGMINAPLLEASGKKMCIINVSRGEITPIASMIQLLKSGKISGLGLDVYEDEKSLAETLRAQLKPNENVQALLDHKDSWNVVFTPHNAFNTQEAIEKKARLSVDSILSLVDKGRFLWPVPVESSC